MASSPKPAPKATSRWNFISQAVASVESRLDTILADDDVSQRRPSPQPPASKENLPASRTSADSSRASISANDRLQERLAKAMAKKNHTRIDSPAISEPVSMSSTPGAASPSLSNSKAGDEPGAPVETTGGHTPRMSTEKDDTKGQPEETRVMVEAQSLKIPRSGSISKRPSDDTSRTNQGNTDNYPSNDDTDATILRMQLEHEDVKTKMKDEIDGYIERIDALNAKLQYMTKEAAENAKSLASDADTGSIEKKLHEKDEKIALLMQEGQKLSMAEMKQLAIIKKLRAQSLVSNKDQDAVRQRAEHAERSLQDSDERFRKAEANSRSMEAKYKEAFRKAQDFETAVRERDALNNTLAEMRAQVAKANTRAENAESRVRVEEFEVEQRRVQELQDDLSSMKVEKELTEDRLRAEIRDLRTAVEREKDLSRAMETEMLAEQVALEGKLESFRIRAEEASANDQGDAHAKLLRQIETLQGQYAAASQNWQGIEGTLASRIAALEKERDELTARESDLRRKLKDAVSKAKSNQKNFEDVQLQYATLQETQSEAQLEMQRLMRKTQQAEEESARLQEELTEQKTKMEREFLRKLDEEKSRWAASVQLARTESPAASIRKSSTYDGNHLGNPHAERPVSRRSSTLVSTYTSNDLYTPPRQHSTTSSRNMQNGVLPETPLLVTSSDPDEYFAGIPGTPISPDHAPSRRGMGDIISTSTVGAGPSVQLVERMSANVRRLESEKEASKDELARITIQRDESRQEVVRLMREAEQKRSVEQRMKKLEQEHKVLNERYSTTLELLGEKSEQVEELKADILDVKQMYRQLADHMK